MRQASAKSIHGDERPAEAGLLYFSLHDPGERMRISKCALEQETNRQLKCPFYSLGQNWIGASVQTATNSMTMGGDETNVDHAAQATRTLFYLKTQHL